MKDGYVPQEEVPVYENKYVKFFKSKPDLPPGMSPSDTVAPKQQQKIPGCSESEGAGLSKSAKRNMKRKEKRKQQQSQGQDAEADEDMELMSNAVKTVSISEGNGKTAAVISAPPPHEGSVADAAEKAKKIKNVKKKLRQVEELQQKVDSGEIKDPTKDQLEKLARAQTLMDELRELERDS